MWWKIIILLVAFWSMGFLIISTLVIRDSWQYRGVEKRKYLTAAIFGGLTWPYWLPRFLKEYFRAGG